MKPSNEWAINNLHFLREGKDQTILSHKIKHSLSASEHLSNHLHFYTQVSVCLIIVAIFLMHVFLLPFSMLEMKGSLILSYAPVLFPFLKL